ncbi:MAG TPA: hypothetical protein VK832_20340 [Burkholderiaceae bacterium]|nr:hypothetical protein [Burkholderiaceae bacterium]
MTHPCGRAGSLFIHSLFDNHPSILTLPRYGVIYSLLPEIIIDLNLERQIDLFIKKCPGIFDSSKEYFGNITGVATGRFGINGDQDLFVDVNDFKQRLYDMASEELDQNRQISRRDFFLLIHLAYGLCVKNQDISQIKYVFYHPHSHGEWEILTSDFPDLYFMAMTRDPRQDWVSWKKIHALRMGRDASQIPPIILFLTAKSYSNNCHILDNLIGKLKPDHIRIIDLELFHVMNKTAMSHLCSWLGIDFDEVLMQSTFNGQPWFGNATNLVKASSFNPTMKRATWRDELSPVEIKIINSLLPGSISYLHYDIDVDQHYNGSFEVVHNGVRYESKLLLLFHCFLHIAGNPLLIFPGIETEHPIGERVGARVRNILGLGRATRYTVKLFRQLMGEKLNNMFNTLASNEKRLLGSKPSPQLFVDYYG